MFKAASLRRDNSKLIFVKYMFGAFILKDLR
jgi:hypothetical protein